MRQRSLPAATAATPTVVSVFSGCLLLAVFVFPVAVGTARAGWGGGGADLSVRGVSCTPARAPFPDGQPAGGTVRYTDPAEQEWWNR